jgi:hypothetical protein
LSGDSCNGPSQHVAPTERKYPAVGHLLISDLKQSADLEGVDDVTTSVLDVSQSIKLHTSAVDPIPSRSLEAGSHGDICSIEHEFENQQTAGVLEGTYFFFLSFLFFIHTFSYLSILLVSSRASSSVQPSGSMPSYSYGGQSQQLNVSQKGTF